MLFRPTSSYPNIINDQIILNGQRVDQVGHNQPEQSFKFLGIHIDETLSWKCHIVKVSSKIARFNYSINKLQNILRKTALKTLYMSIIHSHINCGIMVWGNSIHTDTIIKAQKVHTYHKQ